MTWPITQAEMDYIDALSTILLRRTTMTDAPTTATRLDVLVDALANCHFQDQSYAAQCFDRQRARRLVAEFLVDTESFSPIPKPVVEHAPLPEPVHGNAPSAEGATHVVTSAGVQELPKEEAPAADATKAATTDSPS